jgi:uncharacterized repeat protein (TIGR01451 family)
VNVTRGQLVPYVITVANGIAVNLSSVAIVDRFPLGFRYVPGSGRVDGVAVEPVITNRDLTWRGLSVTPDGKHTLMLLLAVGSGVSEGEFINRAQAVHTLTGRLLSNEASATVRIIPDPDLDCTDVIGKVFDDTNRNGVQNAGERGIGGVRLATARGLLAVTDQYGRFHITCAITPREGRGSNFVLKLDDRTLPSGFRGSTNSLQIKRATPSRDRSRHLGSRVRAGYGGDSPAVAAAHRAPAGRAEEGAGRAAAVVSGRRRGSAARKPTRRHSEASGPRCVEGGGRLLRLRAHRRARGVLATRRSTHKCRVAHARGG